jgi:hypothetical protein
MQLALLHYEFCERSWGAGWQVGQMATPKLKGCLPPLHCVGGTFKGISHELREKNQVGGAYTLHPAEPQLEDTSHREMSWCDPANL